MDQEEDNDIDVQALLASINANFNESEEIQVQPQNNQQEYSSNQEVNEQEQQQQQQQQQPQHQNQDKIIVIRQQAIEKDAEQDPIMDIVNKIEIQPSLLTNQKISQHQLDTSSLQQLLSDIKEVFDKKEFQIVQKQKIIFTNVIEIKNQSNLLVQLQGHSQILNKWKLSDLQIKAKELDSLDIQTMKSKGYILSIIERLEIIETRLDRMIDRHVKQKLSDLSKTN